MSRYKTKDGLDDAVVIEDMRKAIRMYEDGEVLETAGMLMDIAKALESESEAEL
jgi:hypothetical protein